MAFTCPVLGVIEEAGVFVSFDLIAFKDPFEGTFAVDDVVVGLGGDVLECDAVVVEDGAFVFFGKKSHFADDESVFGDAVHGGNCAIEENLRGLAAGFGGIVFYLFVCNKGV